MPDYFCTFVWQREYRGKWTTYRHKDNDILNRAVRKGQKTVSLPSEEMKKDILVNLTEMYQENKATNIEQNIRCLICNGKDHVSWMWQDDDEEWVTYSPQLVIFLEVSYFRKCKEARFYDRNDYLVDFKKMKQINEKTNFSRNIKRETVDLMSTLSQAYFATKGNEFRNLCRELQPNTRFLNLPSASTTYKGANISHGSINLSTSPLAKCTAECPKEYECDLLPDPKVLNDNRDYAIYCEKKSPYSATLTFANVLENVNKCCLLQLSKHKSEEKYVLLVKQGRIGIVNRIDQTAYASAEEAKAVFEMKFYEKTGQSWNDRDGFTWKPGKYNLLNVDWSSEETVVCEDDLEPSVKALMEQICDQKSLNEIMKGMNFDITSGSLTMKQIMQGYRALQAVNAALHAGGSPTQELMDACDAFYMNIPHDYRRKPLPIICTPKDVKDKLDMLESLGNLRQLALMQQGRANVREHPLNHCYNQLKYQLKPVPTNSQEFEAVADCLNSTLGMTHRFKLELVDLFECIPRIKPTEQFPGDYLLLWHGSRLTNWAGILKQGLRISPPEAPSTGLMFGKGLYFADASSKSANYCYTTLNNNLGIMCLCSVAVGKQYTLTCSNVQLPQKLPKSFDTVKGKGKFIPREFKPFPDILRTEAKLPLGPLAKSVERRCCLEYNEYVVYDTTRVEMKYLVKVKIIHE